MAVLDTTQMNQLVREVTQAIQSNSQGVGELSEVSSLTGITSLPTLKNGNQVVVAPISLLEKPAVDAAARADAAAQEAVQIASEAVIEAQTAINNAVDNANDTAMHPTYIGEDNYVYVWNKDAKNYNKTSIYVRGEGFRISKTYNSVEEMYADNRHGLKEGDFVLINTGDVENPDNAKIYVVNTQGGFSFLVDMSGAIGFTGKTPQLEIGIVNVGANRTEASATFTSNGLDEDGNPKYLLNLLIPSLTVQDFTEEEIAILQQPAKEMVTVLQETDKTVNENERIRIEAENERLSAESERKQAEDFRANAEEIRANAEEERATNEAVRKASETARINNEQVRQSNEEDRRNEESARILNESLRAEAEESRVQAESVRAESESVRIENEQTRQLQEQNRISSESVRVSSEETRVVNEDTRKMSETEREASESVRRAEEEKRVSSETERKESEQLRNAAELSREAAESVRKQSEITREKSENVRINNEDARKSAETVRASAESKRMEAEYIRVQTEDSRYKAEESRVETENIRESNEETRILQENGRVSAEKERVEDYEALREDILSATKNANDAAAESRNTPIIRDGYWWIWSVEENRFVNTNTPAVAQSPQIFNGTWWTWDEQLNSLVDTGQSVSSDYQLTKEKIEGVFTGDIESHRHDRYIISDIETIRLGAALGATALQEIPSEYVTESEVESKGYAVASEVSEALRKGLSAKQDNITDLEIIRSGAALGATALQEIPSEYVVESELEAKGYAVASNVSEALQQGLSTKQDNIADLETIRLGAALGATALQEIPSEYVVESELEAKGYAVASNVSEALQQGLSTKQDLNIYFTNTVAADWILENRYRDFKYRCDIPCPGVNENMLAEVIFGLEDASKGIYASVCETGEGIVSVWSSTNKTIVIPTIVVYK